MQKLKIAEKLNPGPWVKHSINTGIAARNIAEKIPGMDFERRMVCSIYDVLPDIGKTSLLAPKPLKPPVAN